MQHVKSFKLTIIKLLDVFRFRDKCLLDVHESIHITLVTFTVFYKFISRTGLNQSYLHNISFPKSYLEGPFGIHHKIDKLVVVYVPPR